MNEVLSVEQMDRLSGTALADDLAAQIRRYVVLDEEYRDIVALWVLHAWAIDAFYSSPRLYISAPEKECGKSTLLVKVLARLVDEPMAGTRFTPAVIYRTLVIREADGQRPCAVLLDEVDNVLKGKKADDPLVSALYSIFNGGYVRDSYSHYCDNQNRPTRAPTFCPAAFAGIASELDSAFVSRAIKVGLRRASLGEAYEDFEYDATIDTEFADLRRRCEEWAGVHVEQLRNLRPEAPERCAGRLGELWKPLLRVATVLEGEWPERWQAAWHAFVELADPDDETVTIAHELLMDMRWVLTEEAPKVPSVDVAKALSELVEGRWSSWNERSGIQARQVALQLRTYGIKPKTLRDGVTVFKGYDRDDFLEAWARYSPAANGTKDPQNQLRMFPQGGGGDQLQPLSSNGRSPHRVTDQGVTVTDRGSVATDVGPVTDQRLQVTDEPSAVTNDLASVTPLVDEFTEEDHEGWDRDYGDQPW